MDKEAIREYILDTAYSYDVTDCVVRALRLHEEEGMEWDLTLETVGTLLGLSVESILSCDKTAAHMLYEKYPYFDMISLWDFSDAMRIPGKAEAALEAIFCEQEDPDHQIQNKLFESIKFSVLQRCEQRIKEINDLFPGTFPHELPVSSFHLTTDYFVDHADIYNLIYERDRVITRFSELFFKSLSTELSEQEIHEFNLFCSHFDARDALDPLTYANYLYIEDNRELFLTEGFTHLEDYLSLKRVFFPWKAREFYDDPQYVTNYIRQHPFSKKVIREFIKNVSAYHCFYVYIKNQETLVNSYDDLETDISDYDLVSCYENDEKDEPFEFSDEILIEKTEDELIEDKDLIDRVRKMVISSKLGGIEAASDYQSAFNERIARMKARFERGWVRG